LAGMKMVNCESSEDLVAKLTAEVKAGESSIVFVDEGLGEPVQEEIDKLNEGTLPAIVLLANPAEPKYLAAGKMNRLMVKAIGSDIFSN